VLSDSLLFSPGLQFNVAYIPSINLQLRYLGRQRAAFSFQTGPLGEPPRFALTMLPVLQVAGDEYDGLMIFEEVCLLRFLAVYGNIAKVIAKVSFDPQS